MQQTWNYLKNQIISFSLFLSLPCCCQCRFKRYIAKQMNSKTLDIIPLWRHPAFPITYLLSFPFSFDVAATNHMIRSFFFFTLQKTAEIPLFVFFYFSLFLPFFLFFFFSFLFFNSQIYLLWRLLTRQLVSFLSYLFQCSKLQITGVFLSFFENYNKKRQRSHFPFFLSFCRGAAKHPFSTLLDGLTHSHK